MNDFLCIWQTLFGQKIAVNIDKGGDAVLSKTVYVPPYQQDE